MVANNTCRNDEQYWGANKSRLIAQERCTENESFGIVRSWGWGDGLIVRPRNSKLDRLIVLVTMTVECTEK